MPMFCIDCLINEIPGKCLNFISNSGIECARCGKKVTIFDLKSDYYFNCVIDAGNISVISRVTNAFRTQINNQNWFSDYVMTDNYIRCPLMKINFETNIPLFIFLLNNKNRIVCKWNFCGYFNFRPQWDTSEQPDYKIMLFICAAKRLRKLGFLLPKPIILNIISLYLNCDFNVLVNWINNLNQNSVYYHKITLIIPVS